VAEAQAEAEAGARAAELEAEAPSPSRVDAHGRTPKVDDEERWSRVRTAAAVAACILLVVVAAVVVLRSVHRTPSAPTASQPTTAASAPPSVADTSQVQSATDAVDSATTGARAGLASLPGFPTPPNVSTIINPYVASLRLYEAFMSRATVPESAQPAAAAAEAQVRQDVRFLETIDGLPPIHLGAFLNEFATDTTQLQTTLTTLEQDLHTPANG